MKINKDVNCTRLTYGYICVLLGGTLWGTTGTSQALLPAAPNPLSVGALRLALGGIVLLGVVLLKEGFNGFKGHWPFWATLTAVLGIIAFQASFFSAVLKTGVAVGTMISAGTAPIFAGILGYLFEKEPLTKQWKYSTFVAISGVILLAAGNPTLKADITGIILAILASILYSLYGLGIKRVSSAHSPTCTMAVILCLAGVLILPAYFILDFTWLMTPRGLGIGLYLGIFATAAAYVLFATGLSRIPISSAYTLSLSEPLTACLLGVVLLGERFTPLMSCGIILLFIGLILLSVPENFTQYFRARNTKKNAAGRPMDAGFNLDRNDMAIEEPNK